MSIYSRSGDDGKTDLFPWGRISKTDLRIEALGDLDELNAWLGILRSQKIGEKLDSLLETFQKLLFRISAELSCPAPEKTEWLDRLKVEDVEYLETRIDALESQLPPIKEFLIFQGPQTAAFSQLARAVCRRAERSTWRLAEAEKNTDPSGVSPEILRWLNRFSDFLFTLGRTFSENVPDENVSAKRNIGSENEQNGIGS